MLRVVVDMERSCSVRPFLPAAPLALKGRGPARAWFAVTGCTAPHSGWKAAAGLRHCLPTTTGRVTSVEPAARASAQLIHKLARSRAAPTTTPGSRWAGWRCSCCCTSRSPAAGSGWTAWRLTFGAGSGTRRLLGLDRRRLRSLPRRLHAQGGVLRQARRRRRHSDHAEQQPSCSASCRLADKAGAPRPHKVFISPRRRRGVLPPSIPQPGAALEESRDRPGHGQHR